MEKCIDLSNNATKILEIGFSYSPKVQMQNNFITTIKNTASFCLWRIAIFKTLAISKIVYLALITNLPKVIVKELKNIQKSYFGKTHFLN